MASKKHEKKRGKDEREQDACPNEAPKTGDPGGKENEGTGDAADQQSRQIVESGSVTMSDGENIIHCLTIIGQVEGHFILPPQNKTTKYEHVIPQIVAVEEDPAVDGLLIILNTVGGDVEAGLAIAELISGMKKPTVSLVLGGGHSIGVPLAVCAKESFIAPTATMTIHPVRMNGIVVGVPQTLSYFDKMQDRIARFVVQNSHITPDRFKELMMHTGELVLDVGTVLEGEEAVDEGLIDHVGGLSDAIGCLREMIGRGKKAEKPAGEREKPEKRPEADTRSGRRRKLEKSRKRGPVPRAAAARTARPEAEEAT